MREILFRGKRTDNGEWMKGSYLKANIHWHERGIHKDWIASLTIQNGGWCNVIGKYAVIPETVGQYTGLTDKNGTKIFEGDIVKLFLIDGVAVGVILYNESNFRFVFCEDNHRYGFDNECIFEVIGNIHDNPELLERGCGNG